jgi:hypothetical protein
VKRRTRKKSVVFIKQTLKRIGTKESTACIAGSASKSEPFLILNGPQF